MPRTVLALQVAPGPRGTAGIALTRTAADVPNKNACKHTGRVLLIAENSGASPRAVTVTSAAESSLGRVGHITAESIAAGAFRVFGPFGVSGWQQADGNLYFEADHAEVKFICLELPPI
jgi:hypothetical protein